MSIPGIENLPPAVKYLIAFAIIFALLALFALVLRRLTGGRLTLANDRGRARQPRLGIVDVYDLDRQRQLILLRRDNVEHLLLVGGPNDVVVETNIVRVAGARLPNVAAEVAERLEAPAADRPPEIAPVRPVVEPTSVRPAARAAEPVVAGHLGRADTVVAPVAAPVRSPAGRPGEPAPRPAAPAPAGPGPRPDRSRATPMPAGGAAAPPRPAGPRPVPTPVPPAKDPESGPGRPPLPDMARQLEDALKRPEPTPARPTPEPVREPAGPPRPQPGPAKAPSKPAPETVAAPAPPEAGPAAPPEPQPASRPRSAPAQGSAPAAVAAPAAPAEPPRQAETAPPSPPPPPPPPEPPAPPSPRPDPFSIEDIEAEFARLLGRPLDRKDSKG
ncbi:hypothetical protein HJG44_04410 [Enterovirga sp. DB1703]|uniref:Flagellar biosynthesis protein FliO n=1 Tax=Enterovirga aerilata TaxID=2730920 RepID=A0A849I6C0_9HYPH|nr:hypothetical protein [Enterovirga sp. DB1703]